MKVAPFWSRSSLSGDFLQLFTHKSSASPDQEQGTWPIRNLLPKASAPQGYRKETSGNQSGRVLKEYQTVKRKELPSNKLSSGYKSG